MLAVDMAGLKQDCRACTVNLAEAVSVGQLVPHMWVPVLNAAVANVLACQPSKDAGLSCMHSPGHVLKPLCWKW